MEKLAFAGGVLIAAAVLIAALILTVAAYLTYCTKRPSRKFRAEVGVILTVTVLSLAIRMAIGMLTVPALSLTGGAESFFYAMFSAIAGLTFNSLLELADLSLVNGIIASFYYGIVVYASLVFLIVITVGLSYEFYSRVQMRRLTRRFNRVYIFTAITRDSIILAQDIKRTEEEAAKRASDKFGRKKTAIIFLEDGHESFSRKNANHRIIMENGFFYFSSFRRTDDGETVSILQTLNFRKKHCVCKDVGENRNRLFYVFAMGDCGGFEGDNAETVFDDLNAVLSHYVKRDKKGNFVNEIPTAVNYFLLTGGEINYESYNRRLQAAVKQRLAELNAPETELEELKKKLQVNVFNEATLSSQDMLRQRKYNMSLQGEGAFVKDNLPDKNGAYRAVVFGFGKTGQYAMEELYIQSAHLIKSGGEYTPTRYIADVYDPTIADKSGLFAYAHPLIRCVNEKTAALTDAKELISRADQVKGQAFGALYSEYSRLKGVDGAEAKKFVDSNMQFPVVAFHAQSGFTYPLLESDAADAAVNEAIAHNVRAFIVALGDDERDIAMANVLIDAFKRAQILSSNPPERHITIFVNLIERSSVSRLNWGKADREKFSRGDNPVLSVVPFGCRNVMFSYSTLIDDYGSKIYNYSYDQYTPSYTEKEAEEKKKNRDEFLAALKSDYFSYNGNEKLSDAWLEISPFSRRSNASAKEYSINYFEYYTLHGSTISDDELVFLGRVEHERWNRFHIANGWIYAPYNSKDKKLKAERKAIYQHNCLCPFDVMLDDDTKKYDLANVQLGTIEGIVYCGKRENYLEKAIEEFEV